MARATFAPHFGGLSVRRRRAWMKNPAPRRGGQRRLTVSGLARLVHDLRLVLIEVETGIKLRLLRKKILETSFVLEGAVELGTVIGEGLLLPLDFMLFVLGAAIKAAQDMLDALNRAERIVRVEIGLVDLSAADEQIGLAVFVATAPAQDLEALEVGRVPAASCRRAMT